MLRIGQIPYLNCEPFFAHLEGTTLVPMVPRPLGRAMAEGKLDAAPLSLVDLLDLGDAVLPLPFGIATFGPTLSVLLFSDRPLPALDGAVIGVTDETSTSVEILRLLLAFRYRVTPRRWVGSDEPADAVLLIGDRAIRARTGEGSRPHVIDLGAEWTAWSGLPCVFARWGARAALAPAERAALVARLDAALERGLADLPAIAARRGDTGWSPAEAEAYLRGFTYRFGPREEAAIAEFVRRREGLGRPAGRR